MSMKKVVVVSAVRTPIGSFNGTLSKIPAIELGITAAKGAIEKADIDPLVIDEVIIGHVLTAGLGQGPARQIALGAGLPVETPAMNIQKVCGSGLRSLSLGAQIIKAGDADVILAGGCENMSLAPHILNNSRTGHKMGNIQLVDTMVTDGLIDAFEGYHMGITAENVAARWSITREDQDRFALSSQQKAEKAQLEGKFQNEIIPVRVPQRKKEDLIFDKDEYPRHGSSIEKFSRLKPAFKQGGTVTAGNASGINDGAAMVLLMSEEKALELGLAPMAEIISYASTGLSPAIMGYGPAPATLKALEKAGLSVKDIDLAEINEAFAAQSLAVLKDLNIDPDIVNVNGGAIALGHPIGASGTRIVVTLLHELEKREEAKIGLSALCIGGGQGVAILFRKYK